MTPDRTAALGDIKAALLDDMEKHGTDLARELYDWLAGELNKHDAASGNVFYLNAIERIERTKA